MQDPRWPMGPQHRSGNHCVNTQLLDSSILPSPSRTSDSPTPQPLLGTWPSSLCSPHYECVISPSLPHQLTIQAPSRPGCSSGAVPSASPQPPPRALGTLPGLSFICLFTLKGTGYSHQRRKRQACCHSRGLLENKGSTGPGII